MVVASVGKLLTATLIARLDEAGLIDVDAPMPWAAIGSRPAPGLGRRDAAGAARPHLGDAGGAPRVVRPAGDCASFLPSLLVDPPHSHRGEWTYSNGNYCALGLLVEAVTGLPLDQAAQSILLDPLGASGVHLTTGGQLPTDVGYALGVERLSRLGGAGAFIVSTDDLAAVLGSITPADRAVLTWPGRVRRPVRLGSHRNGRRRSVVRLGPGGGPHRRGRHRRRHRPSTGGDVCDRVVAAVADDLGTRPASPTAPPR